MGRFIGIIAGAFVLGYIAGVNLPWFIQVIVLICIIVIVSSEYVNQLGLGSLVITIPCAAFVKGMFIGDIITLILYPELRPNLSWIVQLFSPPELRK
mgnify:CR=1 FL=1